MANIKARDGLNASIEIKATGTGTTIDPYVPVHQTSEARTTARTALADGTPTTAVTTSGGRTVVKSGQIPELQGNSNVTLTASTAETTLVPAGAAGILRDLTGLIFSNSSATGVNLTLRDATAGSARFIFYLPPTSSQMFAPPQGIFKQTTDANNWTVQSSGSVTSIECFAFWEVRS